MRLLIAEDEPDLAEVLCAFFEKNRFSVDTVNDGFSAYEYASSGEYDAIWRSFSTAIRRCAESS